MSQPFAKLTFASVKLTDPLDKLEKIRICPETVSGIRRRLLDLMILGLNQYMRYEINSNGTMNFRLPRNALARPMEFFGLGDPLPVNLNAAGLQQAQLEKEQFSDLPGMLNELAANGGGDAAVADFLRTLKALLAQWQSVFPFGEALYTLWRRGDTTDRVAVAIAMMNNRLGSKLDDVMRYAAQRDGGRKFDLLALGAYNLSWFGDSRRESLIGALPPGGEREKLEDSMLWKARQWLSPMLLPPRVRDPHPAIARNELNAYVLGPGMSNRAVSQNDMWWMILNGRVDFLEYLFVDRPDKKRGLPDEEVMLFAATNRQQSRGEQNVKLLQMLERATGKDGEGSGAVSSFRDAFGHDILWYALFDDLPTIVRRLDASSDPKLRFRASRAETFPRWEGRRLILTPQQQYLYKLCDPKRKDAAGLSVDDFIDAAYVP